MKKVVKRHLEVTLVALYVFWLSSFDIYAELFVGGFNAVMPNFAQVYRFIGSVFDPNTSGHLQRLKQMDPINMETVCDMFISLYSEPLFFSF